MADIERPEATPTKSRRDRRREETIADIKAVADAQLEEAGPGGISMRGIARRLAMTATAVHYYFPDRQALLDALVVDGAASLAAALRATYEATDGLSPHQRWLDLCRTQRDWALRQPAHYLLLYGHDPTASPAGRPPQVGRALGAVVAVLFQAMLDAVAADEIDTERLQAPLPPTLRGQIGQWRESSDDLRHVPDGALAGCLIGYAALHGAISLALAGRIPPQLGDASALFDHQMNHISASLHRPPPPW